MPSHDLSRHQLIGHQTIQLLLIKPAIHSPKGLQPCFDILIAESRPQIAPLHFVFTIVCGPGLVLILVPGTQCSTQRPACIAGCRLDPNPFKWSLSEHPSITDTIERDTACQAEIVHSCFTMHRLRQPQHDFFRHFLNRSSQIHLTLTKLRLCLAGGAAEHVVKLAARHGQAGAIIEILHVHSEGTVRLEIN